MPDAILFDLFGVIARDQPAHARKTLTTIANAPAAAFWDAYWHRRAGYDRGQATAAEFWRHVAADLRTSFDRDRIGALIDADNDSWATVDDDMTALVEHLAHAGRRLALLSNIPEELAAYYDRHHHRWLRHFELVAYSCRIGHVKPDPAAFLWCCRELDLPPERVLLVDDRAENIDAARRLGLHAHQFADAATTLRAITAA